MSKASENTGRKQDGTFRKGNSGNPKGRPVGAHNKTTMAALELLEGEAESLTRKVIELALEGDISALRLCLDRLLPIQRYRPIPLDLGDLDSPQDMRRAFATICNGLRDGQIGAPDLAAITALIDQSFKSIEMVEFSQRLASIEEAIDNAKNNRSEID